jgi:hypothetical protein
LYRLGYFNRRLMHVFTYASMTRRLSSGEVRALGGEPVWGCTPADPMGTTVRGTLSGMLAAELAVGIRSDLLDIMLAQPAPARLPTEPLAWMGANAVIRWREMMAGKEL